MSQNPKEEMQQYYFEMFRKAYPLPDGCIRYGDKPDVVIEGSRKIGIEITNFYLEDGSSVGSEQRQRILREDVIRSAQEIYLIEERKPIKIFFGFNNDNPILNKQNLTSKVVQLAKRLERAETGVVSKCLFKEIPELSFVYVDATAYGPPEWRKWETVQAYTGRIMLKDDLAQIVRSKEEQVKGYEKCDAYWLLVIVDFINRAQDQEIRVEGIEEVKSEIFQRIIVYKTFFDHIVEIKIK